MKHYMCKLLYSNTFIFSYTREKRIVRFWRQFKIDSRKILWWAQSFGSVARRVKPASILVIDLSLIHDTLVWKNFCPEGCSVFYLWTSSKFELKSIQFTGIDCVDWFLSPQFYRILKQMQCLDWSRMIWNHERDLIQILELESRKISQEFWGKNDSDFLSSAGSKRDSKRELKFHIRVVNARSWISWIWFKFGWIQ